ncbi:MAG: CDP-diacylglycerol--serine O-phosphatidyltransferase [Prolixibacteraceae bacterium]|jgi:CDP-diacylglycerol--serine O-phosphatidyltransferase|nr:CDP-diacylglycerol--serine O-phosphatidyltransferase [Prolixibacteraceae bacterium]
MEQQTKWYAFFPNLLTVLNLLSGAVAIYFALNDNILAAVTLMFAGAIFDFLDGFAARLLKVSGELGKQLDSLADVVTFGVLPGALMFSIQRHLITDFAFVNLSPLEWAYILSPLCIPALSALRLAKFNIDSRQTKSFIGLPTPANALLVASIAWTIIHHPGFFPGWIANPLSISIITILFAVLLVSNIPMFSLKFSSLYLKENIIRYFFLFSSLTLIVILQITGISLAIILYVTLSIIQNFTKRKTEKK